MNTKRAIKNFELSYKNNKLSHAYIVNGGNKEDRLSFVNDALSIIYNNQLSNPDLYFLDMNHIRKISKNDNLDNINIKIIKDEIIPFLQKSSQGSQYKTLVILDANKFTSEAVNAFLKILEEPSKRSLIILEISDHNLLPKTVRSRAMIINIRSIFEYQKEEIEDVKTILKNLFLNDFTSFKNTKFLNSLINNNNSKSSDETSYKRLLDLLLIEIINKLKEYSIKKYKGQYYFLLISFLGIINDAYTKLSMGNVNKSNIILKMVYDLYIKKTSVV